MYPKLALNLQSCLTLSSASIPGNRYAIMLSQDSYFTESEFRSTCWIFGIVVFFFFSRSRPKKKKNHQASLRAVFYLQALTRLKLDSVIN